MSESLTNGSTQAPAPTTGPTGSEVQNTPVADVQNQEATTQPVNTGGEQASESTTPAQQSTQEVEQKQTATPQGESKEAESNQVDDSLAKFAKSQGFDPEKLTEGERKALTIARDNQKAYRSSTNKQKLSETAATVDGDISRDEITAFQQEFRQYQATKKAEQFFSEEGRDDTLAPVMSEILEEKKLQHGPEYARVLSGDLNLLYDLAVLKSGGGNKPNVDPEAIRREERESINKQLSGQAPAQHASQNTLGNTGQKLTTDWFNNEYNPRDPEHRKMVDKYFGG